MTTRSEAERAIIDEESMLEQVAGLLEGKSDIATWSEQESSALALALEDTAMSRAESWKAGHSDGICSVPKMLYRLR
jgi:hypothetical protein